MRTTQTAHDVALLIRTLGFRFSIAAQVVKNQKYQNFGLMIANLHNGFNGPEKRLSKSFSPKMGNHQISPIYHPALQGPAPELTKRSKSKNQGLSLKTNN